MQLPLVLIDRAHKWHVQWLAAPLAKLVALAIVLFASGCGSGGGGGDSDSRWTELGEVPGTTSFFGHTPLIVSGGEVFVGTSDGVWRRSLVDGASWAGSGPAGLDVMVLRVDPQNENVFYAGGAPETADLPTFYRSDDAGQTWIPAQHWFIPPRPNESSPIHDLAILPSDPRVMWAAIAGDMVLSSDGGMTWALPDGREEEFFGYPGVFYVTATEPAYLAVGTEGPLDFANISSLEIDPENPFSSTVPGPWQADWEILGNRRPNSFAYGPASPDTLYAGVEGALLAMTASSIEWVFSGGEPETPWPYTYVTAIWLDPDDPDHLIFGGKPNGDDARLSLYETHDHGATLRMIDAPRQFTDPAVVQLAPDGSGDLLVLISDGDPGFEEPRELFLYRFSAR